MKNTPNAQQRSRTQITSLASAFSAIATLALLFIAMIIATPSAHAILTLNSVVFDPQIISSGDQVDVIIQYGADAQASSNAYEASNTAYTYVARLLPDDDLSSNYTIITKSVGDDLARTIIGGQIYAQRFGIKVLPTAPAGVYQLKLEGQWYRNGIPVGDVESVKLHMPVKKQGISLSVANIQTSPVKIRAGDKDILLDAQISNSGEKLAKNVEIKLSLPQGMDASYANNNRINLGTIGPQGLATAHFALDTQNSLDAGVHQVQYTINYEDIDSNKYEINNSFPIEIHKRPYLLITNTSGSGKAGESATIAVTVKNVGEDTADSADIRLVKQSSQPFEMDVRTQYLGQLKPNESATAIFSVDILSDAPLTTQKITAALRAKGNSNDGDESIYTFNDAVPVQITGVKENPYPLIAGIAAIVLIGGFVAVRAVKKKRQR